MSEKNIRKLNEQVAALYKDYAEANKQLQERQAKKDTASEELRKCRKFEGKSTDKKLNEKLAAGIKRLEKEINEADARIIKLQEVIALIKKQIETCDIQIKTAEKQLDGLDIEYVLRNKELLAAFMAYAKKRYSENELEFVVAVMNRDNPLTIYRDYIKKDSKFEVNIPDSVRKPLDDLAEEKNYKAMNFSKCADHVKHMIWGDWKKEFIGILKKT